MIDERKGGCYKPEICDNTGNDILGENWKCCPQTSRNLEHIPFLSHFFLRVTQKIGLFHRNENYFFKLSMSRAITPLSFNVITSHL